MQMVLKSQMNKLIANCKANKTKDGHTRERGYIDHKPVIKLFGGSACTWLFSEYDEESECFFGLCDLGMGEPELGYVYKPELEELRFKPFGLPIERDLYWEASKTLKEYAEEARKARRIVS